MTYAKDGLGRSTGRRFNMAAMKREIAATSVDYRGFEISGKAGRWYVSTWQSIYTSQAKAKEAVDACLNLRKMLEPGNERFSDLV